MPPFSSLSPTPFLLPPLPRGKRRNAGGNVGVLQPLSPFSSSHGGSHRLINQTSVNKSLRRSHGDSRRSSYSSFSLLFFCFYFIRTACASLLHDFYRRPPTCVHVFLPSSRILIGIMTHSRKETAVSFQLS